MTKFYITWHYKEHGRNRIKRDKEVRARLAAANIPYTYEHSDFGGGTYIIDCEIPKNISRLVTRIRTHEELQKEM